MNQKRKVKKSRHKVKKHKKMKYGKIIASLFTSVFILVMSVGLVLVIVYKSGEIKLRASAATQTPIIEVNPDEVQRIRESYDFNNTVAWQEDWVVYRGDVYQYKESSINLLLLGIDHSGALDSETDLSDWNSGQADTIFLISLDTVKKQVSVVGIPRNSMVEVEIYNEQQQCIDTIYNQICLQYGYAGGGELGLQKMKECTSNLLYQLPIHGVCAVSLDAVGVVTDMIGGVEVTIPDDMTKLRADYVQGSNLLLTSKNVVSYLRYRDNAVLGSPTTRLTRQKSFMKAAMEKAVSGVKSDPMLVSRIYEAVVPYMNTDITLDEAVYLSARVLDYSITQDSFYQLEGEDKQVDFQRAEGTMGFYDDYYLDEEALRETVMEVFYTKVTLDS